MICRLPVRPSEYRRSTDLCISCGLLCCTDLHLGWTVILHTWIILLLISRSSEIVLHIRIMSLLLMKMDHIMAQDGQQIFHMPSHNRKYLELMIYCISEFRVKNYLQIIVNSKSCITALVLGLKMIYKLYRLGIWFIKNFERFSPYH